MYETYFFTKTQEPYSLLLERREWAAKRQRILIRDHHCCQRCGKKEEDKIQLHVHHKHYISGLDPWEYKDSELITLCEECHGYIHSHSYIPVLRLDGENLVEVSYTPCRRCGGAGRFRQYKHVQNGICFRCHGAKYEELISLVEAYAKEYNIRIEDLDDGFRPFPLETVNRLKEARICQSQFDSKKVYVRLLTKTNEHINAYLDYSMSIDPEAQLDVYSLRYKKWSDRYGKEHIILKGVQSLHQMG